MREPPHCYIPKLTEFKNRTANLRHDVPAPTQKDPDKTKKEPVWKSWLVYPQRKSAKGVAYALEEERVFKDD